MADRDFSCTDGLVQVQYIDDVAIVIVKEIANQRYAALEKAATPWIGLAATLICQFVDHKS